MTSLPGALPQARKLIALLGIVDTFGLKAYLATHQRVVGVTVSTVVTAGTEDTVDNFEMIYTHSSYSIVCLRLKSDLASRKLTDPNFARFFQMTTTGKRTREDARGERVKKARTREKEKQVRVSVVNV